MKHKYEVIVGNVGTVYSGLNRAKAFKLYSEYVDLSKAGYGRAGNEDVTLMQDGNPIEEHMATVSSE